MAPREIKVLREELYHNNVQNQEAAIRPSANQALVSVGDDGEGFFLETRGIDLDSMFDERYDDGVPTLESMGMEPKPSLSFGLWIWEGDVVGTDTLRAEGKWRKLTPVEWGRVQMGKYLWPDEDVEPMSEPVSDTVSEP
jgi:hypothetical protein